MTGGAEAVPAIAVTAGEPAGVGPDLLVKLAQEEFPARLVAVADGGLLRERAARLGLPLRLLPYSREAASGRAAAPRRHRRGELFYLPGLETATPAVAGRADPANAAYVLHTLRRAATGCLDGEFAALVTGPVNKAALFDAGHRFRGHTEYLAEVCAAAGAKKEACAPVMLLVNDFCRVALVTTHLPLREVAAAVTRERLETVLRVLHLELRDRFRLAEPRINVCGLNPHAGEQGHLGEEENTIIEPTLNKLRGQGMRLRGPMPADTAFTEEALRETDVVVAMYHDQGLPVIKSHGFGDAVNITLGLPIVRTSVDHGTALDLAGSGRAKADSFIAAVNMAIRLAGRS